MDFIRVTKENLSSEHICCAISNNKDCQVASKKAWLQARLDEGLVFLKANARGKCFIEYIPAEYAWSPIDAPDYLYIDCLWVSGQFKGHGYSTELLDACVRDARDQGKAGVCVLSSDKKRPFLSDPGFLAHKGFCVCDEAAPFYRLYALPLRTGAPLPRFRAQVKEPCLDAAGLTLYYADQCPYTAKYVPILMDIAREMDYPMRAVHFESAAQAQSSPAVFTSFTLLDGGKFVTNEILSEKKFRALIESMRHAEG